MQSNRFASLVYALTAFFSLLGESLAAPSPAPGHEVPKGHIPGECSDSDYQSAGASAYGPNYGVYYSAKSKKWISAGWCYPVWGYLRASESQVVSVGESITVYASPKDGSNSAEYAPQTASISWQYPGKLVSGCGPSDLACTFIPFSSQSKEWQWAHVHVTMPRTFFIDSPGSNCQGLHICPGVATNAWTFVGSPPCSEQKKKVIDVVMKNKRFYPTAVLATPGTVVRMCNQDPFPQRPYTPDYPLWGGYKRVQPGKCTSFKVPKKQSKSRTNIIIYDSIHSKMRLKIVVKKNAC